MKRIFVCWSLISLLFSIPLFTSLAAPAISVTFTIDERNLYDGMERTYSQGYSPSVSNGFVTIVLPLLASGEVQGNTIIAKPKLDVVSNSPFVFGNYQKTVTYSTQTVNGGMDSVNCYYVRFDLSLSADRKNGIYAVPISIAGRDSNGIDFLQDFTASVTISDGKSDPTATAVQAVTYGNGSGGPTASKPVLTVTECILSGESVKCGETFQADLAVKNEGKRTAHNVKVTIVSDDENIVLSNNYSAEYLRSLPSNEDALFSFEMKVYPLASDGLHKMTVTLAYERTDNIAYADTAIFYINVVQPIVFVHDEIFLPDKAAVGESFTIPLACYNPSKATICNVQYKLEVPGLLAGSCYMGNLQPQASVNQNMSVKAIEIKEDEPYGITQGTCTIYYESQNGEKLQEVIGLSIEIAESIAATIENSPEAVSAIQVINQPQVIPNITVAQPAIKTERKVVAWIPIIFGTAIFSLVIAIIVVAAATRTRHAR